MNKTIEEAASKGAVWVRADERLPDDNQKILYFPTTESCYNYKSYKLRLGIFLKKDQWERENMFCDGSFISADKIAVWMPAPEYNQFDKSETHIPEKGNIEQSFKIFKGDEVNSILVAALRALNEKQLISLRDALIERTPQLQTNPVSELSDEEIENKISEIFKKAKADANHSAMKDHLENNIPYDEVYWDWFQAHLKNQFKDALQTSAGWSDEDKLLDFSQWLGKMGYKINGYDETQLLTIIKQYKQSQE